MFAVYRTGLLTWRTNIVNKEKNIYIFKPQSCKMGQEKLPFFRATLK